MIQQRRIGVVPSSLNAAKKLTQPTGFSQALKVLDAVQTRHALPMEIVSLDQVSSAGQLASASHELQAVLVEDSVPEAWFSTLAPSGSVQVAPFLEAGASQASLLIWPEAATQDSVLEAGWLQSSFVSKASFDAAVLLAKQAAAERAGGEIGWVRASSGDRDRSMAARLRSQAADAPLYPVSDFDLVSRAHSRKPRTNARVLICDPLAGPTLARTLGSSARVHRIEPALLALQFSNSGLSSAVLGVAFLLDRLGFVSQGAGLERALQSAITAVPADAPDAESQIEAAFARLWSGIDG